MNFKGVRNSSTAPVQHSVIVALYWACLKDKTVNILVLCK